MQVMPPVLPISQAGVMLTLEKWGEYLVKRTQNLTAG